MKEFLFVSPQGNIAFTNLAGTHYLFDLSMFQWTSIGKLEPADQHYVGKTQVGEVWLVHVKEEFTQTYRDGETYDVDWYPLFDMPKSLYRGYNQVFQSIEFQAALLGSY